MHRIAACLLAALALIASAGAACAQGGDARSLCSTLRAHESEILKGTYPADQLASMVHGRSGPDLAALALTESDHNQHFESCVDYMLAAAAYRTRNNKRATGDMACSKSLALFEQELGDGKQLNAFQRKSTSVFRKGIDDSRREDAAR